MKKNPDKILKMKKHAKSRRNYRALKAAVAKAEAKHSYLSGLILPVDHPDYDYRMVYQALKAKIELHMARVNFKYRVGV